MPGLRAATMINILTLAAAVVLPLGCPTSGGRGEVDRRHCEPGRTYEEFKRIDHQVRGLTENEVIEMLGEPDARYELKTRTEEYVVLMYVLTPPLTRYCVTVSHTPGSSRATWTEFNFGD
jgi:hypothetical protein